jgi:hypothetical protein
MTTERIAGLQGRLHVKPVGERLNIAFAHQYLTAPLPTPTYPIDVTESISDFGMLANDVYGDCGPAAEVHAEMTTAKAAGTTSPPPDSPLALQRYEAFTGSSTPPGPGVNLADYLKWCFDQKYIKAFAPVDYTDRATCDGLMEVGFGLYVGVNLTDDAEQLFNAGEPWTVANGEQPNPNDGHCILKVKSTGPTGELDGYVTWGQVQLATFGWTDACVEEAWLIVTTEEQLAMFSPSLLADIAALGGTGGTTEPPAPPPTPVPVDPPAPPAPDPPVPTPPPPPHTNPGPEWIAWLHSLADWVEAHL